MLESMTGYGKATGTFAQKKITVELRSLNSKQFDLNTRMPGLYRERELAVRSFLSDRLGRGKVDLMVFVESAEAEKKAKLNQPLAMDYLGQIAALEAAAGLEAADAKLRTVLTMQEVWQTEYHEPEEEELAVLQDIIGEATDKLIGFRKKEGAQLSEDIANRIELIKKLSADVEVLLPERLSAVKERLEKNMRELREAENFDRNRLEQEIIYYLEKLDITEEQVRLESHCRYFVETMNQDSSDAGKKLGFIAQEIGREINTMGSKANHALIQRKVVEMKDELEKIKEQLLNIR
ncbi:MAG TPA: YicC/YloC family endoribonuclease [Cryomorphaceae bacterium]|nr:YicC/YloC family endoribonuclease [Cryomorphaceae bacterium]